MNKKSFFYFVALIMLFFSCILEITFIEFHMQKEKNYAVGAKEFYQRILVPTVVLRKSIPFEKYPYMQEWMVVK